MKSFFSRLWSGASAKAPAPPVAPQGQRRDAPSTPTAQAPSAQREPNQDPAAVAALMAVGARRPLVSNSGAVVGFEFRIAEGILQRLQRRADTQPQAAYVHALLASARLTAQTGRIGFARLPQDWLTHASSADVATGTWIGLEQQGQTSLSPAQAEAIARLATDLRKAGVKIGWDVTLDLGMAPDFLLLRQGADPMAAVLGAVQTWPARLRGLPILATDIANVEDLELALDNGINHVCGALTPSGGASASGTMPVSPEVRRLGQLLTLLATGAETARIVSEIKGDVALSYELLRRINSASLAHLNAGGSIESAVMMLGRNELYRWLSLLLLKFAGSRKASSALHEVALWRSRLLELLAMEAHEEAPGQLFTLGLSSMLSQILNISVSDVVATLNLPAAATQALQQQDGPWYPYLQLALKVQAQELDQSDPLALQFGGAARIVELSNQAWSWAEQHANQGKETAEPRASGAIDSLERMKGSGRRSVSTDKVMRATRGEDWNR